MLGGFFFITGGAFAANSDAVFNSAQNLVSVDNSYILSLDVSTYRPQIQITAVTEDTEHYYVAFSFRTVDVQNGVWRDLSQDRSFKVAKADLGGRDLGLHVTSQLGQIVDAEMDRLRRTQDFERKNGASQKVVATTYSGLVGRFFDSTQEVLPGYVPVGSSLASVETAIKPPEEGVAPPPGAPSRSSGIESSSNGSSSSSSFVEGAPASPSSSGSSLTLSVLGDNPARVARFGSYTDLGAAITSGNTGTVIRYKVDGDEVGSVVIDTSIVSTHTVTYFGTDQNGQTVSINRAVEVYDPATAPAETVEPSSNATTTEATTTPATEPEPEPSPEAPVENASSTATSTP